MSKKLTARQQEILDLISSWIQRHGYPPTRAEICKTLGFRSPNAAEDHLKALARKGAISMQKGLSRGIRLPESGGVPKALRSKMAKLSDFRLPLVGRVAAGSPVLAEENIEDQLSLDPALFHPRPDYLLRVTGLSMKDVGILDGDLLAVHRTPEARNNQIVVARIDDEVTVKRFHRDGPHIRLLPENPDFSPIEIDLRDQDFNIEGLGVGIIRTNTLN